jgi:hypothetical protein
MAKKENLTNLGLTLIEMIYVVAILTIIGGVLVSIFTLGQKSYFQLQNQNEIELNAKQIVANIVSSIKKSEEVVLTYIHDSITYTSSDQTLIIKVTSIDANGKIILGKSDYFIFTKDPLYTNDPSGKKAIELVFPDPLSSRKLSQKTLSSSVETLSFIYKDGAGNTIVNITNYSQTNIVEVKVVIKETVSGKSNLSSFSSSAKIRNRPAGSQKPSSITYYGVWKSGTVCPLCNPLSTEKSQDESGALSGVSVVDQVEKYFMFTFGPMYVANETPLDELPENFQNTGLMTPSEESLSGTFDSGSWDYGYNFWTGGQIGNCQLGVRLWKVDQNFANPVPLSPWVMDSKNACSTTNFSYQGIISIPPSNINGGSPVTMDNELIVIENIFYNQDMYFSEFQLNNGGSNQGLVFLNAPGFNPN